MESWTDIAVKFFLRCLRVYRNPVHMGVPETRYIRVYQEPVHTGVPPYIFLPSPCRTNTYTAPPTKKAEKVDKKENIFVGAKILAEISRLSHRLLAAKATVIGYGSGRTLSTPEVAAFAFARGASDVKACFRSSQTRPDRRQMGQVNRRAYVAPARVSGLIKSSPDCAGGGFN
jgi:hypothetical protein